MNERRGNAARCSGVPFWYPKSSIYVFVRQKKKTNISILTSEGPSLFITCRIVPSSRPCLTWRSKSVTRRRIWSAVIVEVGGVVIVVVMVRVERCLSMEQNSTCPCDLINPDPSADCLHAHVICSTRTRVPIVSSGFYSGFQNCPNVCAFFKDLSIVA